MDKKYWVVGGDYADCRFNNLQPGTQIISGPFIDEARAQTEWHRLTFRDKCSATTRYTIAIEPR